MGDTWKKRQVEFARKRREKAIREASVPRLLDLAKLGKYRFTLKPSAGFEYSKGETLGVMADAVIVRVVRDGYVVVGQVDGESASTLREYLAGEGRSNVMQLQVVDVAGISGVAYAEAVPH
jgi:hypothetical protein